MTIWKRKEKNPLSRGVDAKHRACTPVVLAWVCCFWTLGFFSTKRSRTSYFGKQRLRSEWQLYVFFLIVIFLIILITFFKNEIMITIMSKSKKKQKKAHTPAKKPAGRPKVPLSRGEVILLLRRSSKKSPLERGFGGISVNLRIRNCS